MSSAPRQHSPPEGPPRKRVGRYEILEEIGRGGMGVVYRAVDTSLGRDVALKRPCPERLSDPDARRRFLREARAASVLSHPHIVSVHDVFEDGECTWIAMDLVEGRSLRSLIDERGSLPRDEIIRHAVGLAEALEAAHAKRILHRDITPKNVIVTKDGRARLTDFGLARTFVPAGQESSASTQSSEVSGQGAVVGTPGYMSPEQALARPVDQRSDVFSLGAVLYEMCTGTPAFAGSSRQSAMDAILHHEPTAIGRLNYEVPEDLERIVRKCLAKQPEERYQDCRDLLVDLRALRRRADSGADLKAPERPGPRLARRAAAAAGLVALAALASWGAPRLIERMQDRGGGAPVEDPDLASLDAVSPARTFYERGLHYLTEEAETVRSLDDAIHVFNRAIEAKPDFALAWAGLGETYWIRYQRTRDPASRDKATRAVDEALRLQPHLSGAVRARAVGRLVEGDFAGAKADLLGVLRSEPRSDRTWLFLASAHQGLEEYADGLRALRTGTRLRPTGFQHQIDLGRFLEHFAEYEKAAEAYRKAIDLKPDSAMGWNNLGAMFLQTGRLEEAVAALSRSIEVDEGGSARSNLGTAFYFLKDYEKAVENYRRATELQPLLGAHWGNLGDGLRMLGKADDARTAYLEAIRVTAQRVETAPLDPVAHMDLGLYCARAGRRECALREAAKAAELQPGNVEVLFRNAVVRCQVGLHQQALDWLERAVGLGLTKAQIANDPDLAQFRDNVRFRRLLDLAS